MWYPLSQSRCQRVLGAPDLEVSRGPGEEAEGASCLEHPQGREHPRCLPVSPVPLGSREAHPVQARFCFLPLVCSQPGLKGATSTLQNLSGRLPPPAVLQKPWLGSGWLPWGRTSSVRGLGGLTGSPEGAGPATGSSQRVGGLTLCVQVGHTHCVWGALSGSCWGLCPLGGCAPDGRNVGCCLVVGQTPDHPSLLHLRQASLICASVSPLSPSQEAPLGPGLQRGPGPAGRL